MALNVKSTPSLGMGEALKLASSRLTVFSGRSRRSEFWWWMAPVLIVNFVGSSFMTNIWVSSIFQIIVMSLGLAVTARRLQDTGKSAIWLYISFALGCAVTLMAATSEAMSEYIEIAQSGDMEKMATFAEENMGSIGIYGLLSLLWGLFSLIVAIFCFMDGDPGSNKYGSSPKYEVIGSVDATEL